MKKDTVNIEKLRLSEKEFEEDKNLAQIEFLMEAKPSENPEVTFVVAQPGAGKTALSAMSMKEIKESNGKMPVNINADRLAEYHRNYNELLDYIPEDRFRITREFVNPTMKDIQNVLIKNKVSMVIECTLNSEKKIKLMENLKRKGYKVNIKVLAVDKLESRISCFEREVALLKLDSKARGIDKECHENSYYNMIKTLMKIINIQCWDNIEIFKRGKDKGEPETIYKSFELGDMNIISTIKEERKQQRKQIIENEDEYMGRINKVTDSIEKYQNNEKLKKYTLRDINDLKVEFLQYTKQGLQL